MKFTIKLILTCLCISVLSLKKSSLKKSLNETVSSNIDSSPKVYENENEEKNHSGNCFLKLNNEFFDFNALSDDCRNYNLVSKKGNVYDFNFCSDVQTTCGFSGLFVDKEKCLLFAGTSNIEKKFENVNMTTKEKISHRKSDSNKEKQGKVLRMYLPSGGPCKTNKSENYSIIYDIICDHTEPFIKLNSEVFSQFDDNKCTNIIEIHSKHGCIKEKFIPWYKQFGVKKEIVGVFLIVIGIYFLILGEKFIKINSIVIIGVSSGLIFYSVANSFGKVNIMACIFAGFIVSSIFFFCFFEMITTLISVIIGFYLGSFVYEFLMMYITFIEPIRLFWIILFIFFIIGYIITNYIKSFIIIIASSICGAYATVRGISIFAKGFPDETYVMKLMQHSEFHQLNKIIGKTVFYYWLSIVILSIIGVFIQIYLKIDEEPIQEEIKQDNKDGHDVSLNDPKIIK